MRVTEEACRFLGQPLNLQRKIKVGKVKTVETVVSNLRELGVTVEQELIIYPRRTTSMGVRITIRSKHFVLTQKSKNRQRCLEALLVKAVVNLKKLSKDVTNI